MRINRLYIGMGRMKQAGARGEKGLGNYFWVMTNEAFVFNKDARLSVALLREMTIHVMRFLGRNP